MRKHVFIFVCEKGHIHRRKARVIPKGRVGKCKSTTFRFVKAEPITQDGEK